MSVKLSRPQSKKFKELVIYVAQKSNDDPKFGSIKLNKIVAYSEMVHFANTGKSITGASYMKQPMGVVARCMKPVLGELAKAGELVIVPKERHGYTAKVPTALRSANVDEFTASEIVAVDEVLRSLQNHHGTSSSELSHRLTPNWDFLPLSVDIPISSLLYPSEYHLTPEEHSHFKQILRDTDWGKELTSEWAAA